MDDHLGLLRSLRNDSYYKIYKYSALQMSDLANAVKLHFYEHAVVTLSDDYWRGQCAVNSHCSIFLTTDRNAMIRCNEKEVQLKPYCFYFLPSQMSIQLSRHDGARLYHTHFRMSLWGGIDLWNLLRPEVMELSEYPEELLKEYMAGAVESVSENNRRYFGEELLLFSWLYKLLGLFFADFEYRLPVYDGNHLLRIRSSLKLIDENPEKPHTVTELARHAGMCRERFSTEFKKLTGISPAKYCMERRLQALRIMMRNSDCTVVELADRFGFSSPYHLSKVFKKYYGLPPREYQKSKFLF